MSRLQLDRYSKKLREMLEAADDEAFLVMLWATDALQSGREKAAAKRLIFSGDVVVRDISNPFMIQKWELETLATQLLTTPKRPLSRSKPNRVLICTKFEAMRQAVNHLRQIEDAEAGIYLNGTNVMNEMHRIAHRSFPWQRGFLDQRHFYRSAFIYGHEKCSAHFLVKHGISLQTFQFAGFVTQTGFFSHDLLLRKGFARTIPSDFQMTEDEWQRSVDLLSISAEDARVEASKLSRMSPGPQNVRLPVAFQPSVLRQHPIISFGGDAGRLRCPLPLLITQRITTGLYYDVVVGGPSELRNEVADRFEQYGRNLIAAYLPGLDVRRGYPFPMKKTQSATPDILIRKGGKLRIVVECKATKLTVGAQFYDEPFGVVRSKYDEIANGVLQLWRYFSQVRLGVAPTEPIDANTFGMVLTHDAWLMTSKELQADVMEAAGVRADKDPSILPADRRPVAMVGIADLEIAISWADEAGFLKLVSSKAEPEYWGWTLPALQRELKLQNEIGKPYPFDVGEVMPWWRSLRGKKGDVSNSSLAGLHA